MSREDRRQRDSDGHPSREQLIDLVDGGLGAAEALAMNQHVESCAQCAAYVHSIKASFALASLDAVPEPGEPYWRDLEAGVRRRVRLQDGAESKWWAAALPVLRKSLGAGARMWGNRRRLALVLSPGLAVALALVLSLALNGPQAPSYVASTPGSDLGHGLAADVPAELEPPLDGMTVEEIARSMSEDAIFTDLVIEAAGEDISSIEQYLLETDDIGVLIEDLADDEAQDLAATLADRMKQQGTRLMSEDDRDRVS